MPIEAKINAVTGKPEVKFHAFETFIFENGAKLEAIDLGLYDGAKLSLDGGREGGLAIMIPPEKAAELGSWLLRLLSNPIRSLSPDLEDLLCRLEKDSNFQWQRGDKKILKHTITTLKQHLKRVKDGAVNQTK